MALTDQVKDLEYQLGLNKTRLAELKETIEQQERHVTALRGALTPEEKAALAPSSAADTAAATTQKK